MGSLFKKLISVLLMAACVFINTSAFAESNLTIHFLDVGQGAAAIIQCDGEVMMFDGGSAGNSSFIYSYLQNTLGLEHIDVMVASHPHEDHIGGLSGALNACSVGTIYSPVTEYDSKQFSSLLKYAGKQGLSLTVPAVGDTFTVGSATATFLSPAKAYDNTTDSENTLKTATQPEAVAIRQRWRPYMEQLPEYQYLLDTLVAGSTI